MKIGGILLLLMNLFTRFTYHIQVSNHPGKEDILKFQSTNWDEVVRLITGNIPDDKFIWYQKHMVHHISNEKNIDWLKKFS